MPLRSILFGTSAVLFATIFAKTVSADTVMFHGYEHTSLGTASLELTAENTLRVSNLTDLGNDGVAINLGAASRINVGTSGDDGKNGSGSRWTDLTLAVIGAVGGVANQFEGTSVVKLMTGMISIGAEYSGVTSTFRQAEVWNDGTLIGAFPDYTGEISYMGDFEDYPLVTRMQVDPVNGVELRWAAFRGDRLFTVGPHGDFLGDEIRFKDQVVEQIDYLSEARLTTLDFSHFTLRNVSVPEPGCCALAALALIGLASLPRRRCQS
jgi:hypothetical protein